MALFTKLIVYGRTDSGKFALADRLIRENVLLRGPKVIRDPSAMHAFLKMPESSVGILHASCARTIMKRCADEKFGTVLFIPAPAELVSDEALDMQNFVASLTASADKKSTQSRTVARPRPKTIRVGEHCP